MGKIFNKDKDKKPEVSMTSAPEEPETPGEIKHIEELNNSEKEVVGTEQPEQPSSDYVQQIPVCMSQTQINNMVIESHMMLKQVLLNQDQE